MTCNMAANTLCLVGLVHNILACDTMQLEVYINDSDVRRRNITFFSILALSVCSYMHFRSHHVEGNIVNQVIYMYKHNIEDTSNSHCVMYGEYMLRENRIHA